MSDLTLQEGPNVAHTNPNIEADGSLLTEDPNVEDKRPAPEPAAKSEPKPEPTKKAAKKK